MRPPALILSRRTFLASLAAAVPLELIVRRAHAAAVVYVESDPATLDALADVVLPSALGKAGIRRAAAAFRTWGVGYRASAELNHGYGTSRLRSSGLTPLTRWTQQLDALDAAARAAHRKPFRDLSPADRGALVREALAGQREGRMPAVGEASHVAVALLAHFYDSSAATDLCYQAQIGRSTCRRLADSSRKPLPSVKLSER